MNIGVILAAGDSKRFGSTVHKQYLKINGKEMVSYAIRNMKETKSIDCVLLVVDKEEYDAQYIAEKYGVTSIEGGTTRNQSIQNAIDYIARVFGVEDVNVIFHDSVRPFVQSDTFEAYLNALISHDCVAMAQEVGDGLSHRDGVYADRNQFLLIQAPEAVRMSALKKYFDASSAATSISQQMSGHCRLLLQKETKFNLKITYPEELFLAEQLMRVSFAGREHRYTELDSSKIGRVLLFGASGGIGGACKEYMQSQGVSFLAPSHEELDLCGLTVEKLSDYLGANGIDAIINAAAAYCGDEVPLTESFDYIFSINVKANLTLIEYAKTVGRKINLVFLSSSSSTMGRKNLTNYSAAKAALNSIVESQSDSLARSQIYLNAIVPEKVKTPLIEKLHKTPISDRELLEPQDVLNAILYYSYCDEYGKLVHIRKGL